MTTFFRGGLHDNLVQHLGRRIVTGELSSGDIVDPAAIELDLKVSRTVVREAIKVLTTKGLLGAKPRFGTFVRARADWNLLDSDIMEWRGSNGPDAQLLRELDEVRRGVEPLGARLAAERRTDSDLLALDEALGRMQVEELDGEAGVIDADIRFHQAILAATHNELLGRLELLLAPGLRIRDQLAFGHLHRGSFIDDHAAVLEAIRRGDGDAADNAMTALLRKASTDTERVLRTLGTDQAP